MTKHILVGYATKSGSTAEVANFIGDALSEIGAQVTVSPVEMIDSPESYDAILIGSPIIYGKCMREVKKFVQSHVHELVKLPLAYFITCMRLSQIEGDPLPNIPIYIDPTFGDPKAKKDLTFPEKSNSVTMYLKAINKMSKEISPISISFFRGVLDYSSINFVMTLLFKIMAKVDGLGPGDYRNWEAIDAWTKQTYIAF